MGRLTGAQRKYLRGLAHGYKPIVRIGANGLTESVVHAIDQALNEHELIKVKFGEYKESKEELAHQIEGETGSEMVGMIGHVGIFYREHPEAEKRQIHLP